MQFKSRLRKSYWKMYFFVDKIYWTYSHYHFTCFLTGSIFDIEGMLSFDYDCINIESNKQQLWGRALITVIVDTGCFLSTEVGLFTKMMVFSLFIKDICKLWEEQIRSIDSLYHLAKVISDELMMNTCHIWISPRKYSTTVGLVTATPEVFQ